MIAKVLSYALLGLEGVPVAVETDISRGLPAFEMVGLPDAAVKEARERVKSAVKNSGLDFPPIKLPSILRPPTLKRKARRSICPSPSVFWRLTAFYGPI